MQETIMVVEDDVMIRELIRTYLEKNAYHVVEAEDGLAAKDVFLTYRPCLIILDLMLPKISGEEFCEWVKEQDANVSIIMLSAKVHVRDRIKGLEMGADDYMTKPFDPHELIAQVQAVLRRTDTYRQKIVHEGLCLMPHKGEVLLYDRKITLTHHEFRLLYLLMRSPDRIFSREELINELYPNDEKTIMDRTIDAHIKKLREKIEVQPSEPQRIQTVRGMGYKFVTT